MARRNPVLFPTERWRLLPGMFFKAQPLAEVVTIREACFLWMKHRTSVDMQIAKGRLEARLTLNGGAVLITTRSLRRLWGEPIYKALDWARDVPPDFTPDWDNRRGESGENE